MRKGFTLIELLFVILILIIISSLTIVVIDNVIMNSKEELYETQIDSISEAAKTWAIDNAKQLPEQTDDSIQVTLYELQTGGYISKDLNNPMTGEYFENTYVIITRVSGYYTYTVVDE
ncbi:MAG: prepilin-type N-terminal cleavage/methylation domain-containing protein [Mycoplasmatota bacterium]